MTIPAVERILPHSTPMVLLDSLDRWSPERSTASVTLRAGMRLLEGTHLDTLLLIEHMAQTIAASLGYEAYLAGQGVKQGMLVGCREYDVFVPQVDVGDRLTIEATRISVADAMSRFRCRVARDAEPVAEASVTLFHGQLPD